jgi:hypothetical protein
MDLHNGRRVGDTDLPATQDHPNALELVTNGTKIADHKKLKYRTLYYTNFYKDEHYNILK